MNEVKNEESIASTSENEANDNVSNQDASKNEDATKLTEVLDTATQLAAELKKAQEERDNYKQGMLSAKNKLKDLKNQGYVTDDSDEEDEKEAKLVLKVVEAIKPFIPQAVKTEDDLITRLNKQVSELKVAVKNRSQVTSASYGNNTEEVDNTPASWTPQQLAYFKENGLDPNKVKENLKKYRDNAI